VGLGLFICHQVSVNSNMGGLLGIYFGGGLPALYIELIHGFFNTFRTIAGGYIKLGIFMNKFFNANPFTATGLAAGVVPNFFTYTAHGQNFLIKFYFAG
jgi:hypothetical protein